MSLDVVVGEAGDFGRAQSSWSTLGNDLPWIDQYDGIYFHWIDASFLQYGIYIVQG